MTTVVQKYRVLIPTKRWTPVRSDVFSDVLPELSENRSAALYLNLYDKARHSNTWHVRASNSDMVRWTGLNVRTVEKCLQELRDNGFVRRLKRGTKHSHLDKPLWSVPMAEFSAADVAWVPVPRFLIRKYCRRYPNAVVLIVLLSHQHIQWLNHCWPGVPRLSTILSWSQSRVCEAIRTLGHENVWRKLHPDLPCPLAITWKPNKQGVPRRHYSVLAVKYKRMSTKGRFYSTVAVSTPFAKRFRVRQGTGFEIN